ncbi:hypothetical protein [Sinorhizobium meliloti]
MTAETHGTDFDDWLVSTYRDVGSFTMLFVLLRIGDTSVDLLRSAYLHVVGDELRWPDMVQLFRGAGVDWSGAVFYRAGREGLERDAFRRNRKGDSFFCANQIHHSGR